jgi:3-oxoacyl-[acyl-carrier protein] reductase
MRGDEGMEGLNGKVAVVTGGGGGLGSEISKALAAEGARVVVNDILEDPPGTPAVDRVVAEIDAAGGKAIANRDSVATFEGGERIVRAAADAFRRLDILVMPAGNFVVTPLIDLTEEEWNRSLAVHLTGTISCARAAARLMIAQGDGGRIITFGSRSGFLPNPGMGVPAYAAAKAGIMGMTASLATELEQHRITVNCIIPSAQTKGVSLAASLRKQDLGARPRTKGGMPPQISMDPGYVAPAVVYLASPKAGNVTGRYVYASGGDVCIYPQPFRVQGAAAMLRKQGKWTPEELAEAMPAILEVGV